MFNPSDLSQLSGAAKTLRGEILEILAASPEPMTCHDIMQVSVLCPDRETMTREVFAMKKAGLVEPAGEINSPGCTRPVWLYRLSANGNAPVIAEPDAQLPSAPAEDEEKTMQTEPESVAPQPATKVTTKDIRDLVIAHPGIKRDDVYKALVFADGSNKKKVGDLISCLISTKHLTQSDEGGVKRLHPGERLNDALASKRSKKPKAEAKVKAPVAKLLTGEASKPFQEAGAIINNGFNTAKSVEPTENPSIPASLPESAQSPTPRTGNDAITAHLSAIAAAVPPGVIFRVFKDTDGRMEITLDTKSGATFNVGENLDAAARCIHALAALQPFAED